MEQAQTCIWSEYTWLFCTPPLDCKGTEAAVTAGRSRNLLFTLFSLVYYVLPVIETNRLFFYLSYKQCEAYYVIPYWVFYLFIHWDVWRESLEQVGMGRNNIKTTICIQHNSKSVILPSKSFRYISFHLNGNSKNEKYYSINCQAGYFQIRDRVRSNETLTEKRKNTFTATHK